MSMSVPQDEEALPYLDVELSHDEAPLVAEDHSPAQRRPVRTAVVLAVIACACVAAAAVYNRQDVSPSIVTGGDEGKSHGVVQLAAKADMVKARAKMQEQMDNLDKKMAPMKRQDKPDRLTHMKQRLQESKDKLTKNVASLKTGKGQREPASETDMRKARNDMQQQIDELNKKMAPMKREDKPDRLAHMKKRFQSSKERLEKKVDELKDQQIVKASTKPVLKARRRRKTRKLMEQERQNMKKSMQALNSKVDGLQRNGRPQRLQGMRSRLENAKTKLKMHLDNLAKVTPKKASAPIRRN